MRVHSLMRMSEDDRKQILENIPALTERSIHRLGQEVLSLISSWGNTAPKVEELREIIREALNDLTANTKPEWEERAWAALEEGE